jgi:D-threo-aldose 1-dehydrogenase
MKSALGRTCPNVSKICFGILALGDMPDTYGYSVGEKQAKDAVRAIFTGPANFLDTSRNHGFGRSEQGIGVQMLL